MKRITYLIIFAVMLMSCEPDEPKVKYSSTFPLSGEWGVTYKVETSPGVFEDIYGVGYSPLSIYNTATDKGDSIWLTDNENFWEFKVKVAAQPKEKTFSTTGSTDLMHGIAVTVSNGQVILNSVTTKGAKTKTDSIYMQLEFEDDPGTIYHCSGVRRTGYLEDDDYYGF